MARIAGVTIPKDKRVEIGLTYVFGIGLTSSKAVLKKANVNPDTRVKDLQQEEVDRLRQIIEQEYRTEGDLRRDLTASVKRLKDIRAYRGIRHMKRLPARGQTSRVNSRTVRGNKRSTAGSGRRSVSKT